MKQKLTKIIIQLTALATLAIPAKSNALLPPNPVDISQAPSTLAFVLFPSLSKCTATKVAPRVFLTAGHCFKLYKPEEYDISLEQVSKGELINQVRTTITKLEVHPGYRFPTEFQTILQTITGDLPDIAMFKTKEDINIPSAKTNFTRVQVGEDIIVGGYGDQGRSVCHPILHPCSLNLAKQKIALVKNEFFVTKPTNQNPHFLTPGDSGGPVYVRNSKTHDLEVVGVNSMMAPASLTEAAQMIFAKDPPKAATIYIALSEQEAWYVNIFRELTRPDDWEEKIDAQLNFPRDTSFDKDFEKLERDSKTWTKGYPTN